MEIGDKVMVPRTGGGYSLGEVIEVYKDRALVTFPLGTTFRGRSIPTPPGGIMGHKTININKLKPVPVKEV